MRVYQERAHFITLIAQIVLDVKTFAIMLLIICLAFANFFYVIDQGDKTNKIVGVYTRSNIVNVIMEMYFIAIGNSSTDGYSNSENSNIIWVFFMLASFIIVVVFMNLLISIMGNTLNNVQEVQEQSQLQEQALMIMEYFYLLNHKDKFSNKKYIINVTLRQEQIQSDQQQLSLTNLSSLFKILEQNKQDSLKQMD